MKKIGEVWYNEKLAGHLSETNEGYEFLYHVDYIKTGGKPISLTLPLTTESYTSTELFPFFDGLIPEGWLLHLAINHWNVKSTARFELLLSTCSDAIGAVSITPQPEKS